MIRSAKKEGRSSPSGFSKTRVAGKRVGAGARWKRPSGCEGQASQHPPEARLPLRGSDDGSVPFAKNAKRGAGLSLQHRPSLDARPLIASLAGKRDSLLDRWGCRPMNLTHEGQTPLAAPCVERGSTLQAESLRHGCRPATSEGNNTLESSIFLPFRGRGDRRSASQRRACRLSVADYALVK